MSIFDKLFSSPVKEDQSTKRVHSVFGDFESVDKDKEASADPFGQFFGGKRVYKPRHGSKLPLDVQEQLNNIELYNKLWNNYCRSIQGNWGMSSIPTERGFETWLVERLREQSKAGA